MKKMLRRIAAVWRCYRDGFRQMTWGRVLWLIIVVKLAVIFLVLRLFFFQPELGGLSAPEKAGVVGERLALPPDSRP